MDAWGTLFAIAVARCGVVALSDADAVGLARETVMARARREGWRRLHPGIYLLPGAPDDARARLSAATLRADGHAARRSALWLHGVLDAEPVRPQVVVTHARRGVVGRGSTSTARDGCPTTTSPSWRASRPPPRNGP